MTKSKGKDLRYRMRKKGYQIFLRDKVVILPPDDSQRSKKMETRIRQEFKYRIQYYML